MKWKFKRERFQGGFIGGVSCVGELHACRKGTGFTDTLLPIVSNYLSFKLFEFQTIWVSNLKLCRLSTEVEGGGLLWNALLTLELSFRRKQTNTLGVTGRCNREGGGIKSVNFIWNCATHNTQPGAKIGPNLWEKWLFGTSNVSGDFTMKPNLFSINPKSVCKCWWKCSLGNWNCDGDAIEVAIESAQMQSQWDWLLNATLVLTQPPLRPQTDHF